MNLYLDLEDTVIDSWDSRLIKPVQCKRIKDFMEFCKYEEFSIFSYAIWNDADREVFNAKIRPMLEKYFECECVHVPTVQEMMETDHKLTGLHFNSISDYIRIRGKADGFRNWVVNMKPENDHYALIDDAVTDMATKYHNTQLTIEFFDVANLV